ncbi:MAG: Imm17 family immunity protein [Pirellulales bacterium]|jgi:hypothetical protein
MDTFVTLILIGGGLFSILGAALDWDFFMESHKAKFFVSILGRFGARCFYVVIGLGLVIFGILIATGAVGQ